MGTSITIFYVIPPSNKLVIKLRYINFMHLDGYTIVHNCLAAVANVAWQLNSTIITVLYAIALSNKLVVK